MKTRSTTRGYDLAIIAGLLTFLAAVVAMASGCEGLQEFVREAQDPVIGAVTENIPEDPSDMSAWIGAGIAAAVAAAGVAARKYMKRKKD